MPVVPSGSLSAPVPVTASVTPTKNAFAGGGDVAWKFSSPDSTVFHGVVAPLQLKAVPMMRLPRPSLLRGYLRRRGAGATRKF